MFPIIKHCLTLADDFGQTVFALGFCLQYLRLFFFIIKYQNIYHMRYCEQATRLERAEYRKL